MKTSLRHYFLLFCCLITLNVWGTEFEKIEDIVAWRDSMELVYRQDPYSMDLSEMEASVLAETDAAARGVRHYLLGQCYQQLSNRYRFGAPQQSADYHTLANKHFEAARADMDALAEEPASRWMGLMADTILLAEESLLEILYLNMDDQATIEGLDGQYYLYYKELSRVLADHHLREGSVLAQCKAILQLDDKRQKERELQQLLLQSLDTKASGVVLTQLVNNASGTLVERVHMAEQYLSQLRPDADTAQLHKMLLSAMRPSMRFFEQDTTRYYVVKHIRQATLRLYKAEWKNTYRCSSRLENLSWNELVYEEIFRPAYEGKDWRLETDTLPIHLHPAPGLYMVELSTETDTTRNVLRISSVNLLTELDEWKLRFSYKAVASQDGRPLKGARVQHRWNPVHGAREVRAYINKEDHTDWEEDDGIFSLFERIEIKHEVNKKLHTGCSTGVVMTDRAIYRPGQTVEIAAMLGITRGDGKNKVGSHKKVQLYVRSEGKDVLHEDLRTDSEGRVTLSFPIPQDAKPGSTYGISIHDDKRHYVAGTSIRVLSYRRPQAQAVVESDVVGDSCFFYATVTSASGERLTEMDIVCVADEDTCQHEVLEDGRIRFYGGSLSMLKKRGEYYSQSGTIHATLPNGETLSSTGWISMKSWPYTLQCETEKSDLLEGRDSTIVYVARDGNGRLIENVPIQLKFESILSGRTSLQLEGLSGQPIALPDTLHSGNYMLYACSAADTTYKRVNVFSPSHPKGDVNYLSIASNTTTMTEVGADLYILSPWPDVMVTLYVVDENGKKTEYQTPCVDNLAQYHLDYKPGMTDLTVDALVVYNGNLYHRSMALIATRETEKLELGLRHFSDKTHPGAEQQWILTVQDNHGKAVSGAAVVASMYDATLDQLAWMPSWLIPIRSTVLGQYDMYWELMYERWKFPYIFPVWVLPTVRSSRLQWSGFAPLTRSSITYDYVMEEEADALVMNEVVRVRGLGSVPNPMAGIYGARSYGQPGAAQEVVVMGYGSVSKSLAGEVAGISVTDVSSLSATQPTSNGDMSAWLRQDFREVALWSTHGVTDRHGELSMQVTIPDQLTSWHLRVLAYDSKLRHAQLDTLMRVEQQLTLQPLWPRMLRYGDCPILLAQAHNRSDNPLSLNSILEVRSADSTRVLATLQEPVTLAAGEVSQLRMPLKVSAEWGDSVRISWMIGNEMVGDGEQQWVAILPGEIQAIPDTTLRRSPLQVLGEQLKKMRIDDAQDALRVALALYVAHEQGRYDAKAEARLHRLVNKDKGIAWCPGGHSSPWVTMQVMDMLLKEGKHTEIVRNAMTYLDKQMLDNQQNIGLKPLAHKTTRELTDMDIHYLVLSAQVERDKSAPVDSLLQAMESQLRTHILSLSSIRQSAHTPLTIYGVSEVASAFMDNGTPLAATAADHVRRLSLYKPEWGRYFKEDSRNSRIQTQLSAIRLMSHAGRQKEADEMTMWLAGQVWSRAWQSPILMAEGRRVFVQAQDSLMAWTDRFDSRGLIEMTTKWSGPENMQVGSTTQLNLSLNSQIELDYVRITIPMAASMEPARQQSGYQYMNGLWVYVAQYDDRVELFIEHLPVGVRELALSFHILRPGTYTLPAATLQSEYWPEIHCMNSSQSVVVKESVIAKE